MKAKALLLVFLLAAAGIGFFATAALAMPTVSGCVEYYSDATFSQWVGYKCWGCTGAPTVYGTQTEYNVVDNPFDSCGGGGGTYCICSYWYNPITGQDDLQCDC